MAQDQSIEMQDKTDGGCLSPADEEREPCLKETDEAEAAAAAAAEAAAAAAAATAEKNNGVAVPAQAAVPATDEGGQQPADNNNSSSNGKFHALAAATTLERKLRDKTGFSRTGLAVAAVAVLLCLVLATALVVMTVKWPPRPVSICRRASCLRASAEVLPKINFTLSPCDNFKEYACGGWLMTNSLPAYMSSWSLKKRIQQDQKIKIRNMVVTLRNVASSTSLNWKMKHFYESCMNLDNIETDEGKPLKKIISAGLGGWHVLRDFNVHAWDLTETIVPLHSKYNVNPFFRIDVVPDDKAAGKNIIQIAPAGLGLPDRRYYYRQEYAKIVEAYKHYMMDVSQLLGATSSDASVFSEDMFHYEKRIAEITPAGQQEDPFATHRRFTVSKIKEFAGMIPLLDILQSKFPDSSISDDTYVSVVSPIYFSNLSSMISTSERSGLNDYFMWKMAEAYVPYLSVKFREIVKIYQTELTGEKDLPPRWETCVTLLQKFMGFGVAASIETAIDNKGEIVSSVNDIFINIKETIRNKVDENKDLSPEMRDYVIGKLDSLTVQVGVPDNMLSDSYINQFYNQMSIQKLDFFQNINHAVSFINDNLQLKLKSVKEEAGWLDDLVSEEPKVTYNKASNKVIVPMSLLSYPYFETGFPEALLYGGIGVEISSAILSSIYPPGIAYDKDGVLLPALSAHVNRSISATIEASQCLGQYLNELDVNHVEVLNKTALSAMMSVSSVRYALESLSKKTLLETNYRQPAMESYAYDALFFITYAQSLCSIKSLQQNKFDTMYDDMSNESILLKTVADHLESFKNAFTCPGSHKKTCKYIY